MCLPQPVQISRELLKSAHPAILILKRIVAVSVEVCIVNKPRHLGGRHKTSKKENTTKYGDNCGLAGIAEVADEAEEEKANSKSEETVHPE